MPKLDVGQPARLTADAVGSASFDGRIDRISPVVDPSTGTVKITVATPGQKALRPGMYVQVELVTTVHENAVKIPKKALVYDNEQIFLFRLAEDRLVERVPVVPVLEDPEFVEAASGLEAGDQIVVAGQSGLKDGSTVRLPGDPEPGDEDDGDNDASDEKDEQD